jgi:fructose-1,6-bisphosphatase/sedoheptulose 1,7-bisphosphatase-like protein
MSQPPKNSTYKRWTRRITAEVTESVYYHALKKIAKERMTMNAFVSAAVIKALGVEVTTKLLPEQKEELALSVKNQVNSDLRRQAQASAVIIGRKKLSGIHAKKETNTENESNNLFTRTTKQDF